MDVDPVFLAGHGIGYYEILLAVHRRLDLVSRMVLVSGASLYTGDLDNEEGFSAASTRWGDQQTLKKGTHIGQAYLGLYEQFLFYQNPGTGDDDSVLEQALDWPLSIFKQHTASML